jgi:lipooligosaccharide transport system permease protein
MKHYHAMASATPRPSDIYDGVVGWLGCHVAMTSAAFLAVAAGLGGVKSAWAPLAVPAAVLGALAVAAPLAAFSATQESDAAFSAIMRLAVIPLFLFSGTFFPVTLLPGWAQALVVLSPLWHAVELCRAATTGHLAAGSVAGHLAFLAGCVLAGAWWGHRAFTRRLAS